MFCWSLVYLFWSRHGASPPDDVSSLANMAKKQRGKTTSSSSKTLDKGKQAEQFRLVLESSEDEAPEEVTFEDSKAAALRSLKQALDADRR